MFTIGDIIDMAVQIEQNGEKLYRDAAEKADDPRLASTLQWLADEEVNHAEKFSKMKEGFEETVADPSIQDMGKGLLRRSLGDKAFSLEDIDLSSLDQVETLLEWAIEFEQDTILFYEMIRTFLKDKGTRKFVDEIIEEELGHIRTLEEFLEGDRA
jgi:rubrerythrin